MKGKRRKIGFRYAWNGLKEIASTESNFQLHLISTMVVILCGIMIGLSNVEWAIIMLTIGLVLVTEMINSSIEKVMDYVQPEIHPAVKHIKDVSAGAVLIAAIIAVIVGIMIFAPKIMELL
ncbi:diacylglycerol kinase family protein [Oceanobacillus sp. 1P07AA]|uniref:diacylglycerol kinase family protein n=1 Tax=Oceanobacillus sp. 1P07AA TaxID=3132293 RepID=UPI0039A6FE3A